VSLSSFIEWVYAEKIVAKFDYSPIYNVIGTLKGQGDQTIILGNHHDSWCCGAIDPVSGSAAMNEVARGLGMISTAGWMLERTMLEHLILRLR
jgi:N-acetylated-alpha-linked acidic dipeptidase